MCIDNLAQGGGSCEKTRIPSRILFGRSWKKKRRVLNLAGLGVFFLETFCRAFPEQLYTTEPGKHDYNNQVPLIPQGTLRRDWRDKRVRTPDSGETGGQGRRNNQDILDMKHEHLIQNSIFLRNTAFEILAYSFNYILPRFIFSLNLSTKKILQF